MYAETLAGWTEDGLLAGPEFPVMTWQVDVEEDAEIKRGELLCGTSASAAFVPVTSAADAQKYLVIAAQDFTADADHTVAEVYVSGLFNREKIILGGASLELDPFVNEMRKQNLHVKSLKD